MGLSIPSQLATRAVNYGSNGSCAWNCEACESPSNIGASKITRALAACGQEVTSGRSSTRPLLLCPECSFVAYPPNEIYQCSPLLSLQGTSVKVLCPPSRSKGNSDNHFPNVNKNTQSSTPRNATPVSNISNPTLQMYLRPKEESIVNGRHPWTSNTDWRYWSVYVPGVIDGVTKPKPQSGQEDTTSQTSEECGYLISPPTFKGQGKYGGISSCVLCSGHRRRPSELSAM